MPTFTHKPTENKVFFAHIPRTAGRYVDANLLWRNNFTWDEIDLDTGNGVMTVLHGEEIAHWHKDLYEEHLNVKDIPNFSIVRNPVDRFISCSIFLKRMYGDDIQEAMEDPIMFGTMLQNFPLPQAFNWFRPQMDFITNETQIWKLEDGFGEDFEEFVSGVLGMEFKIKDVPYDKLDTDETKRLEKSDKLIDNIRAIYRRDYEQLYPELAASF